MRAKRAKHIRAWCRGEGFDPSDASYDYDNRSKQIGNPFAMTIILDPTCGRKFYQTVKREYVRQNNHAY